MKKILLLLLFILMGNSQDTNRDSYTIQRLIIFNNNGDILLEKHQNGWMTPALRHNNKLTINEGLEKLAIEFGLKISAPKLSGIFLFISDYKPQSSFRQHFIANVVDGKLVTPKSKLDAQWFSPKKAIEMMSLPDAKLIFAVRDMTQLILENPDKVWAGSYTLWKENNKTKYQISEKYYTLTD